MGRHFLAAGFPVWDESWRLCSRMSRNTIGKFLASCAQAKTILSCWPSRARIADAGFCTQPLTHAQLLCKVQGQPVRLIPRCVITQSSGKQRIIDSADVGGQSERSSDPNKLTLCSPIHPAQHVAVAMNFMEGSDLRRARQSDSWEGGGEDWPDAYRHCPMSRAKSLVCVVAFWHEEWAEPAYQLYTGLLFGLQSPRSTGTAGSSRPQVADWFGRWCPPTSTTHISQIGVHQQVRHGGRIEPSTPSWVPPFLTISANRWLLPVPF